MKKVLGIVIAALLLVMPVITHAAETIDISKYQTKNFVDTLKEESIEKAYKSYSENDKQVTIYLFRGQGCGYCRKFLTFLNGITDEYGKYFKVVSFEVWNDQNNSMLLSTISTYLGEEAGGVPYIVIGDKVFPGYSEEYDADIKKAITELYESKDKYDVFEAYNDSVKESEKNEKSATSKPIIWNFIFTSIAVIVVMCYINISNKKILSAVRAQRKFNAPESTKKSKR